TENGLKLGLAAALESHPVFLSEIDDLLYDVALLIDLDRINRRVFAVEPEFFPRLVEPPRQLLDSRAKDVREPEQHGQRDALLFQVARDVEQIERPLGVLAVRANDDMAAVIDVEEPGAPPLDVVQRPRGVDRPARSDLGSLG